MPRDNEGRDGGDASTSPETPKSASKPPTAGRETWNSLSLIALMRNQLCGFLDLGLLAPEL